MTKKRTSMLKVLLTVALAMILSLTISLPSFADGPDPITWDGGTVEAPAQAAVTKILKMPVGTTTPGTNFTFNFTAKSYNEKTDGVSMAKIPPISSISIPFKSDSESVTADGKKTVTLESGNIFEKLERPFDAPGVYVYTVTESTNTFSNNNNEKMDFSHGEYDLYVYVKEGKLGTETVFYVYLVGAVITVVDEGGTVGDKVDPTPSVKRTDGKKSQMIFTNYYLKTNNGSVLELSKKVEGEYGDNQIDFTFKVKVTQPATVTDTTQKYKAIKIDADGEETVIPFTSGETIENITLKHGEKLYFIGGAPGDIYSGLPVGASFEVTETGTVDYTPKYVITLAGVSEAEKVGTPNTGLGFPSVADPNTKYLSDNTADSKTHTDTVVFTNTRKDITPTGISVDNLPYFAMIALAVLALIGYVLIKSRASLRTSA